MKKIDKDGLLLCELQAEAFDLSISMTDSSSEIFIRRFMNSNTAKTMDSGAVLETNTTPRDLVSEIDEEYGASNYGSVKYSRDEIFWIGYLYRYFAYYYALTSSQVYKIVKPKELRGLYEAYHTLDVKQAIERILEAKHLLRDREAEIKRQYEIYKNIRLKSGNR